MTAELLEWLPEGWGFLVLAALLAGLVRGFSGFGTSMVYLPVASAVLPPFEALSTLMIMDLIGPLPTVRRTMKDAHMPDVWRLGIGAMLAVPVGVAILSVIPAVAFRWAVSLFALILLVLLISGVRYRGKMTKSLVLGTGALGGMMAGAVGLPGPPVIMLYMASNQPVSVIRANLFLYLILTDILLLIVFGVGGLLVVNALILGALLCPVYLLANMAGAAIFAPSYEKVYRAVAYVIIAGSAVMGLPVWG